MTNPAKEAAIELIKKYVERGDSLESFRGSYMGHHVVGGMSANIGGYMTVGGKFYSQDWILVERDINGKTVNQPFKLKDIYNEIKQGQQVLL